MEDPLLMWLTHLASKSVLYIGKGPQFLSIWILCGLHNIFLGWHAASSRVNNLRDQSISCNTFYDLKPYTIIPTVFHWSLGQPWFNVKKTTQRHEYQEARIIGGHLGGWLLYQQSQSTLPSENILTSSRIYNNAYSTKKKKKKDQYY